MSFPGSDLSVSQLPNVLSLQVANKTRASIRAEFTLEQLYDLETATVNISAGIRAFQNAFVPVMQLDPDVLTAIFQYTADQCYHDNNSLDIANSSYSWISVTQVCGYWRKVAQGHPQLWSTVDSRCPAIAQLCIERSKNSSLHIILRPGCPTHLSRRLGETMARTLVFDDQLPLEEQSPILAHFTKSAPRLKSLSIILPKGVQSDATMPSLTHATMPSLTHLRISGFILDESAFKLTDLVHLELKNENVPTPLRVFLDALESNPGLETFIIWDVGPFHFPEESEQNSRVVNLPHLRLLHLEDCCSGGILKHITVPRGCRLTICNCEVEGQRQDVESRLETLLPTSMNHLENMTFFEKLAFVQHPEGLSWAVHGSGPHSSFGNYSKRRRTDISFEIFRGLALLSLSHIRELWVQNAQWAWPVGQENYRMDSMARFIELETLTLVWCKPDVFLETLMCAGDAWQSLICPKLRNVTISYPRALKNTDILAKCLKYRSDHGAPLERLNITCFPTIFVPADEVLELKQHVGKLRLYVDNEIPTAPFEPIPSRRVSTG